jgi:CHU_C Type IX secretion signal domain
MSGYFYKSLLIAIIITIIQPCDSKSQTIWRSTNFILNGTWISEIYKFNLSNCEKISHCTFSNFTAGDLIIHPSSKMYVSGSNIFSSQIEIRIIDSCKLQKVINIPNYVANYSLGQAIYSFCSDKDGQIYIALSGKKNIYRLDPDSETFIDIGILPNGMEVLDFTFRNGKLYASGITGPISHIMEIDLNDITQSKVLFSDNNGAYFGLLITVPNINDCKEAVTYISRWVDNLIGPEIGILDFSDGSFTQICLDDGGGMASPLEFLASDPECDLLFDLDRDNSSGVFPYDFRNENIVCTEYKNTTIADDDLFLHTSVDLDSIIIRLDGDVDGNSEGLTLDASLPDALLSYQNGRYILTLSGDRSDDAWRTALQAIRYSHTGSTISAGVRTLTIAAYNVIKSNQAQSFIHIGARPYAGRDTTLLLCTPQKVEGVSFLLGGQTGGYWQPALVNDVYDPSIDNESVYQYIIQSPECGNDTAVLNIQKLPNRTLDLGPDVSICQAESLIVSIPVQTGDQIRWSDGSTETNRSLKAPGKIYVDITTADGCIISDTIIITRSYLKIPKSLSIDLCSGDTYSYHGTNYLPGQIITDSVAVLSGCDTLITITLRSVPAQILLRDTFTCDNATLFIQNVLYNVGDTIVRYKPAVTGCDTLIKTVYQSHTLPQLMVIVADSVLCAGKTTTASVSPSTNLTWSTGDTKSEVTLSSGTYFVSFTDDKGCIQSKSITIDRSPVISYDIDIKMPDCDRNNGSILVVSENAPDLFEITINDIPISMGISDNLGVGNYNIRIMDKYGCISKDTIILTTVNEYTVSMADEITIEKMKLHALAFTDSGGTTDTILFSPDTDIQGLRDSILIVGVEDRIYSISFVDQNGCVFVKSLKVNVTTPASAFELPNVISLTSAKNENRLFYLKSTGITYDMSIYDRWGNQIYDRQNIEGGNPEDAWTPEKSKVQPGVYVYFITIHTPDGAVQKVGTVTVL